ncbi:MAG: PQQ-binding-like beta-propeller repeat protein [Phycisphaerae bacterium]|jgi:outer membrane protein assembly factor BamB
MTAAWTAWGADQPQWGRRHARNMVSDETGLPAGFDPASGRQVRWTADLGTETYSTPIVASGRVFIGTNNLRPRDPHHTRDCGVLMCFDEKDGRFCWQLVVPKLGPSPYLDWPRTGMVSPCTVEGDRVYMLSNRNEVMCLDLAGMANGNDGPYQDEGAHMGLPDGPAEPVNPTDADVLWLFDIDRELGVHQHDAAHCSILIDGPYLYLCSSNGVDDTHLRIVAPEAPGLIVLDKATGRLVARDRERMAPNTIHCTWSSPAIGEVNGRRLVFFGGGDGVCYAFEALPPGLPPDQGRVLKKVWSFDCDPSAPKENVHRYQDNRREGPVNIMGMPVFHGGRVFVAAGGDFWHGRRVSWLKCIDAAQTGDVTRDGQVWSYAMDQHCMSTPAIHDGLVYIADCRGRVHCLDLATGKPHWVHPTGGEIWASTMVADGKVYVGNRSGELWVLAASREKKVLATVDLDGPIQGTPTPANGTLYVATMKRLYAIGGPPAP